MKHECKITVLDTKCFPEYQEAYLADPKSGLARFSRREIPFCSSARLSRTTFITL
jgi:hypothetical protein